MSRYSFRSGAEHPGFERGHVFRTVATATALINVRAPAMSCSKGRDNLVPQFTFQLNHKVLARRVTVGKYDGLHPCITAATASDKVLVHNNNRQQRSGDRWEGGGDVSLLNVNQTVSCVAAGCLKPGAKEDVLLVGTPTALLAYDVENNCDLFFREVADGANSLAAGYLGSRRNPVVLVGGNCSIQGFDHDGEDVFWTVTGDNVRALALYDFNKDGLNELLVGSEDFDIRVFRDDVIVAEIAENEAITALCPLTHECFAYALANGTIGVYRATERLWRIKSKSQAVCLHGYDIDGDGRPELITGWSNGKVDARSLATGEVVFRDSLAHGVAGIVQADYCLDGREQLIVVSTAGEVRGYLAASAELRQQAADATFEQDTVRELSHKKQTLLQELRNYETSADGGECGSIPANTQLKTLLAINSGSGGIPPHVEVALETNNETVIRAVILFAEGIFDGESLVWFVSVFLEVRQRRTTIAIARARAQLKQPRCARGTSPQRRGLPNSSRKISSFVQSKINFTVQGARKKAASPAHKQRISTGSTHAYTPTAPSSSTAAFQKKWYRQRTCRLSCSFGSRIEDHCLSILLSRTDAARMLRIFERRCTRLEWNEPHVMHA
ncbi:BBSome complex member BBS2-like isoform X8 [Dermacentor andersoni]|uniref:BBSome complex member BBS2-like isoform X8 n=1 Tax=Dermacentor andersoni TaxID=34620 RepID=UPI003B3A4868